MASRSTWVLCMLVACWLLACSDTSLVDDAGAGGSASVSSSQGAGGQDGGAGGAGAGASSSTHCYDGQLSVTPMGQAWQIRTPHYELYSELTEDRSKEAARLLEASWGAFEDYFVEPPELAADERFRVRIYASQQAWFDGMTADGVTDPPMQAGGYFSPATKTAYLYDQPTRYYTHVLTVHEAAHQFHLLGRARGASLPGWFVEGTAEFISRHDWDGRCVRLGVRPLISQEDPAKKALDSVMGNGLGLEAMVGEGAFSRPVAMSVVRYFERANNRALAQDFLRFRDAVDIEQRDVQSAFIEILGAPSSHEAAIEQWLATDQEPMSVVFLEWTHIEPRRVRGQADGVLSVARFKSPVDALSFAVDSNAEAGFLLAYESASKFVAVVRRADGRVQLFSYLDDSPVWLETSMTVPSASVYTMRVERLDALRVKLTINQTEEVIEHGMAPAASGLAVQDGSVVFEELDWQ